MSKQAQDFEVLDTTGVQIESLIGFMRQLGYSPARHNGGFFTENPHLQANRSLSNATAIYLHNLRKEDWVEAKDGWYGAPGTNADILVSVVGLNILQATKLVKKVKMQATRKGMGVQIQSHMVKPVDKAYTRLLGLAD